MIEPKIIPVIPKNDLGGIKEICEQEDPRADSMYAPFAGIMKKSHTKLTIVEDPDELDYEKVDCFEK